jgi:Flp pilus assembly protein TadB
VPVTAVRDHHFPLPRRLAQFGCLAVLALALGPTGGAVAASGHGSTKTKHSTAKPKTPLAGWLGNGTKFPARALVLSAPAGTKLSTGNVHVTENGAPAGPLTVTQAGQAGPGDFGALVLVDQSASMAGAPLAAAINATRSLAAQRTPNQQLGLVTFDSSPTAFLRLTSNAGAINTGLAHATWTGKGSDPAAAISLALGELSKAKVALGAIIVVSDGAGIGTSGNAAEAQGAAAAVHVPIFTVGLQDNAATASSLQALSKAAPGQFVQAPPARLSSVLKEIYSTVTQGYVVRWHSQIRRGQAVNVAASATGVPGTVAVNYTSPAPPAPPAPPKHAVGAPAHAGSPLSSRINTSNTLSPLPSFARETPVAPPASSNAGSPEGFWASSAAVPAVALITGVLIAMAIAFGLYRPSQRGVRTRVRNFIPGPLESGDELLVGSHAHNQKRGGLFRALEHGSWWPPFVEDVLVSRNPRTAVQLVKRSAAIGVVLAVLVTVVSGSILLAMLPLLGWPFALRMLVKRAARKQREKFKDVLPGYLQDLASAMRVGRSFVAGISAVAETADEPIKSELERAVTDEALGRPLEASLEAVAVRMQASDMDQVAMIAGLNRRTGSNVAESLDRVAEGARDRADLRREMKALTGQAKMSSMVLTALPGILLLGINLVSPLYAHPLFHTTLGIVLLGVGACMVFAGWRVMKKITDVEA